MAAPGAALGRGGAQPGVAAVDVRGARGVPAKSERGRGRAALAEAPLDCNKYPAEGANAASAKVRHSSTLLVLFCLYSFFF